MNYTDPRAAAVARASATRAHRDRPTRRRCAEQPEAQPFVRAAVEGMQLRASEDDPAFMHFTGYASVTERGYTMWDAFGPYTETVAADAFDETLGRGDLDVPLVLAHDSLRRLARTTNGTLELAVDAMGLRVDAAKLDPTDPDVAYIAPKIRAGLIDEMSFAFRIDAGEWNDDFTEFRILKVDLHRGDVAIVGYGANPFTAGGMREDELPAPAPKPRQVWSDGLDQPFVG